MNESKALVNTYRTEGYRKFCALVNGYEFETEFYFPPGTIILNYLLKGYFD